MRTTKVECVYVHRCIVRRHTRNGATWLTRLNGRFKTGMPSMYSGGNFLMFLAKRTWEDVVDEHLGIVVALAEREGMTPSP